MRSKDSAGLSESTRPFHRADVVAYALLDEMVLYQDERGVVLSLNRTARAIWELCDGQRSIQEIVTEIGHELNDGLPAELERLEEDVRTAGPVPAPCPLCGGMGRGGAVAAGLGCAAPLLRRAA